MRSSLRSSHSSAGTADILVPERVLHGETQEKKGEAEGRREAGAGTLASHSQAVQVVGPREDGEVLHHVGPSQHPETHGREEESDPPPAEGTLMSHRRTAYRECSSDRFWNADAPTKDRGLS